MLFFKHLNFNTKEDKGKSKHYNLQLVLYSLLNTKAFKYQNKIDLQVFNQALTLLFLKHSKLQDLKRKKKGSNQDTMES
jgi:hypothetical protein